MSDLVEFLKARFNEDEQTARKVTAMTWSLLRDPGGVRIEDENGSPIASDAYDAPLTADELEHIARHDPARVLREVEAKRRMLPHLIVDGHTLDHCDRCMVLRLLALPYADHPDHREEWKQI